MIKLTRPERRLRDLLVSAANTWPTKHGSDSLVVRFAGGWVRDKLLAHDNADIDVAVNIATGVQFASHVQTYLSQTGIAEKFDYNTISRNVEQSKHLETATARFLGLDLDFVNLRSEEYADDSRIPESMKFGTPKEDAERRDLTINSLFYNLHTEDVEDWTGYGIQDIKNGIIRTPLDPIMTFKDDPLRVLRAVRFAARLNFKMTPEVQAAIMDPVVKHRLRNHVTIPRKADEVKKLLKGPHHLKALKFINDCNLYNHIFTLSKRDSSTEPTTKKKSSPIVPPILDPPHPATESVTAGQNVRYLLQHPLATLFQFDATPHTALWVMAGLTPWRGLVHPNPPKREPKFCASLITKHELMYGEDIRDIVEDTFERGKLEVMRDSVIRNETESISRVDAVILIRKLGRHWRMITFTSLLHELIPHPINSPSHEELLRRYQTFAETIYSHGVENAYDLKRLIPGNELAKQLGGLSPRRIANAQEKAVVYQILHNITSKEAMEGEIAAGRFSFP